MPDYQKSVIYTIKTGNNLYVGSTINFTNRKHFHKKIIYNEKYKVYNCKLYKTIRENGGEWVMKPYKEYPCENKTQLTIEEERIRSELNADLNMVSCSGIDKEKRDKYEKDYYVKNKNKILEKNKEWKNKNSYKITCECGCLISKRNLMIHKKTKKHLTRIEQ